MCNDPQPIAVAEGLPGVCTRSYVWEEVRACSECDHHAPAGSGRRHVLMHLLPVAGRCVWRRAVARLNAYRPLFTGRAVVAVATGDGFDPPAAVRRELPWATVLEVPNDPELREVATWRPLWDALLPDVGPADAVLYCHGKGVTRAAPRDQVHEWAALAWTLCLDHWPVVARLLAQHPLAGPFKKVGYGFGHGGGCWHYTGTFFWTSAVRLRERLSVEPPRTWWGVEAWPGLAHPASDAGCIFHSGYFPKMDLYKPGYWAEFIRPEFDKWIRDNPPSWPWIPGSNPSAGGSFSSPSPRSNGPARTT